jgi:hypothetical protein
LESTEIFRGFAWTNQGQIGKALKRLTAWDDWDEGGSSTERFAPFPLGPGSHLSLVACTSATLERMAASKKLLTAYYLVPIVCRAAER